MKLTLPIALLSLSTSVIASQKPLTDSSATKVDKHHPHVHISGSDSVPNPDSKSTTHKKCASSEEIAQVFGEAWAETVREGKHKQHPPDAIPTIHINLEDFEEKQCDYFERVYDGWRFTYSSKMTDCDYTSLSQTVGKAVVEFIEKKHFKECRRDCDTMCMRFDEGGPWDGYVRLGKKDKFDPNAYCGPSLRLVPNRLESPWTWGF
ncbi:hypothetical protein BO94DRAFT_549617 [Aspergillus sclerotioniger CBS 115572]|uniref:Secreted protein CSS2 C-terminal domain-containing protein n=1 Tax=Aspergillus sclerotioniger CBS 115572 TaxID=1450535 RepID=A0A317VKR6_9EURO|nr:hypothetical protein BO94DRAFT_549617 [Aspergillus sclerotioniger CBS 115572]PWY74485.1 hypothetical protein BO94DRAFT_549617 [Aspergillus sclerotioniger CBS 115572]